MSTQLKITIIGAGPAGCLLGRILHLNNIPFTIFEGEASSSIRSQGSTLDLHPPAHEALKECRLYGEFRKYARYDGEAVTIADKDYKIYLKEEGRTEENSTGRPEIDRTQLRQMLVDSLPAETIKWNHRLRKVDEHGTLHFDHGKESEFDLVVGADGAWSKIRPLVTDVKPFYTGLSRIGLTVSEAKDRHPDLYGQVNRASLFVFSDGKSIQAQQLGDGSIHMYTWSHRPEKWMNICNFDLKDPVAVRNHCAELFSDWHPQLKKFVEVADDSPLEPRNLYMMPVGNTWEHRKGFTLIGDAAHLMTPFAGEGVNLAIVDALKLGQAIIQSNGAAKLDEMVERSEQEMFVRVEPVQQETKTNMDGFFQQGSDFLEDTVLNMIEQLPPDLAVGFKEQLLKVGSKRVKDRLEELEKAEVA